LTEITAPRENKGGAGSKNVGGESRRNHCHSPVQS
jgi:hypothetical protein